MIQMIAKTWYRSYLLVLTRNRALTRYDIYTSIAYRIKNPLRRTSEHITLHDLKH